MCGIVGAAASRPIEKILLKGLKHLEYRGYDSAGIALLNAEHHLERLRTQGKVRELEILLEKPKFTGNIGIAHTRWATHGIPSEQNAHPLMSNDEICLVHNGIIENHDELKHFLVKKGYQFTSETDTEAVVHLLHYHFKKDGNLLTATQHTIAELKGAYALGILSSRYAGHMIAVRHGSPLVIGMGIGENFFASDALALLPMTKQFMYLEDGDIGSYPSYQLSLDWDGTRTTRKIHNSIKIDSTDRGEYRHYISKKFSSNRKHYLNLEVITWIILCQIYLDQMPMRSF